MLQSNRIDPKVIKYLSEHQLFEFIISLLESKINPSLIFYLLKCLFKIFQSDSSLDLTQNQYAYQFHMLEGEEAISKVYDRYKSNSTITKLCDKIIEDFFQETPDLLKYC